MTFTQTDRTRKFDSPTIPSRTYRVQTDTPYTDPFGLHGFLPAADNIAIASVLAGCAGTGNSGSGDRDDPANADEQVSTTDNYDSIIDRTGQRSLTVDIVPVANEFLFAPPMIRIDPGMAVTWKWIGSGNHDVVAPDSAFDSGAPETFQHTFESPGTIFYFYHPQVMGKKGAAGDEGEDNQKAFENASN